MPSVSEYAQRFMNDYPTMFWVLVVLVILVAYLLYDKYYVPSKPQVATTSGEDNADIVAAIEAAQSKQPADDA